MNFLSDLKKAKEASRIMMTVPPKGRVKAIHTLIKNLKKNQQTIFKENSKDLNQAKRGNLKESLIDRLKVDRKVLNAMISSLDEINSTPDFLGEIVHQSQREDGLIIKKQRIPLGVIAMIFESRPNVITDSCALAVKSGNCIILKGGKEAKHSNQILGEIINCSFTNLPVASALILPSDQRRFVAQILKAHEFIDVVIPRGGEELVKFVFQNATMPVIAHYKGLCHTYIDRDADLSKAIRITVNAKAQRTGVCNATETLLVHQNIAKKVLPPLAKELIAKGIEIRADINAHKILPYARKAKALDWDTEYLDPILSIKIVENIEQAIAHIQKHGTKHTECIISENQRSQQVFINNIDASCITVNASTRFNDGGQLGLGAEIGISTSKFHSYGPMGAKELTTFRYLVEGRGHIRT